MNHTTKKAREHNPLDEDEKAARQLLAATRRRKALYTWLRELADPSGYHEVHPREAERVARYTIERVGRLSGFSPEECQHINAELDAIEELTREAYPKFRS